MSPEPIPGVPANMPIKPAATVMAIRDGKDGLEVCLLRRNLKSEFVGGLYLFPGGAVDPADGEPDVEALCDGLTDAAASAKLGLERGGIAFWVAAIREAFEEAGLLFARHANGTPLRLDDPVMTARFAEHRRAVDSSERRLVEIAQEEDLRFDLSAMHYVSHWVTPPGQTRRYDTRFFLVAAPEAQEAVHDDREVISATWITPEAALDKQYVGEMQMMPPTVVNLRILATAATVADALAAAAAIPAVPAVIPRLYTDPTDGTGRIVMPSDPRYAEADGGNATVPTAAGPVST